MRLGEGGEAAPACPAWAPSVADASHALAGEASGNAVVMMPQRSDRESHPELAGNTP